MATVATRPTVSIVMPAHNAALTIGEAIGSVRDQLHASWELIIVDDGSSDDTTDVVELCSMVDPKIRLCVQSHGGASQARNRGIEEARGEWIVFLDSDDVIHPDFLRTMLASAGRSAADVVVCGYARMSPAGHELGAGRSPVISQDGCKELASCACFPIHAALVRREIVVQTGGFDALLSTCEDWDFWLRIAGKGARFATVGEALAHYRNTPRSLSKKLVRMYGDAREVMRRQRAEAYGPQMARFKPSSRDVGRSQTWLLLWCGAIAIAQGRATEELLSQAGEDLVAPLGHETWQVEALVEGAEPGIGSSGICTFAGCATPSPEADNAL